MNPLRRLTRPSARTLAIGSTLAVVFAIGGAWASGADLPLIGSNEEDCPEATPAPSPTPSATAPASGAGLQLGFSYSPSSLKAGDEASWTFAVTNTGDQPVTLTFPSGQKGDVVLNGQEGEAYRWSACCAFTQAVTEQEIAPGETWEFTLDGGVLDVEPGTYELTATVESDPAPSPHKERVTVSGDESPSPSPSATPDGTAEWSPAPTASTPEPSATVEPTPEATP